MTIGIDTTFLVSTEILEHPGHGAAREALEKHLASGHRFALAPQVLLEFAHVVTDPRRFERPLDMRTALRKADVWWTARETIRVFPDDAAVSRCLGWIESLGLGRKRLLDTMLAATYVVNGVTSILTANSRDYRIFGELTVMSVG